LCVPIQLQQGHQCWLQVNYPAGHGATADFVTQTFEHGLLAMQWQAIGVFASLLGRAITAYALDRKLSSC